jgi:hypothetical protein
MGQHSGVAAVGKIAKVGGENSVLKVGVERKKGVRTQRDGICTPGVTRGNETARMSRGIETNLKK